MEQVWESVAAAAEDADDRTCLVLLYLAGGNDGLNVVLPNGNGDTTTRRQLRRLQRRAPGHRPRPTGRRRPAARSAPSALPGPGRRARWRSPTHGLQDRRRRQRRRAPTSASTRSTATARGGAGSNLAVMPAVDAKKYSLSHFDNSRHLVRGQQRPQQQDRLARPLDRPQRLADEPAAGDLDRHRAVEVDPHRGQPGVRDPVAADGRLHGRARRAAERRAGDAPTSTPTINDARGRRGRARATRTSSARATTYGLAYDDLAATSRRSAPLPAEHRGYPNTGTLSTRLRTAAHLLGANLGTRIITIHWGGFDTHTNQLTGQDSQLEGALARARRVPGRPDGARDRRSASRRSCSRSSAGA